MYLRCFFKKKKNIITDGIHTATCGLPLRKHQDSQFPAPAFCKSRCQNEGKHLSPLRPPKSSTLCPMSKRMSRFFHLLSTEWVYTFTSSSSTGTYPYNQCLASEQCLPQWTHCGKSKGAAKRRGRRWAWALVSSYIFRCAPMLLFHFH